MAVSSVYLVRVGAQAGVRGEERSERQLAQRRACRVARRVHCHHHLRLRAHQPVPLRAVQLPRALVRLRDLAHAVVAQHLRPRWKQRPHERGARAENPAVLRALATCEYRGGAGEVVAVHVLCARGPLVFQHPGGTLPVGAIGSSHQRGAWRRGEPIAQAGWRLTMDGAHRPAGTPRISSALGQVAVVGLICFCCPGMFNAIVSVAGGAAPTLAPIAGSTVRQLVPFTASRVWLRVSASSLTA